ncbi:DeoR/GlpR transcriptional regulator [Bacillus salipaludis]|uniref:DeoR family transcriptional regulator n=1 Tax=Bacillus salipaludis TaxID=2547811 RepID=A0A4R5VZP1_9BACI|nr:DeoR family transcriptional regulator [Bacillus salipaludis]MDQ6596709.1 DeoR family transcriptional regulator [Bacillus salipaludis]TDK65068.1 DeoR/GlpR transcriptional regulator [Bacillus salipaludis]
MLPVERRKQIVTWLNQEGALSISEISKRLNVSEMTVYRDIKPLLEEKKIIKTSGGISLTPITNDFLNACTYCLKESNNRHPVQIILNDLRVEQLCCPHCGLLRYKDIEKDVSQIICRDFLSHSTVSARMAYYLMDADFNLSCCQPQVLTFESLKHAEQFQKGFGGNIRRFQEAVEEIQKRMNGEHDCTCHK